MAVAVARLHWGKKSNSPQESGAPSTLMNNCIEVDRRRRVLDVSDIEFRTIFVISDCSERCKFKRCEPNGAVEKSTSRTQTQTACGVWLQVSAVLATIVTVLEPIAIAGFIHPSCTSEFKLDIHSQIEILSLTIISFAVRVTFCVGVTRNDYVRRPSRLLMFTVIRCKPGSPRQGNS